MTARRARLSVLLRACLCGWLGAAGTARAASLVTLHSFGATAGVPYAGLARDGAAHLFGTTYAGGGANGGTVFELSPPLPGHEEWRARTLHSFGPPGGPDGNRPLGALIADQDGVLYGTTSAGGLGGGGTIFALTPPSGAWGTWTETVLATFPAGRGSPASRLLRGADGALYGTTMSGGAGLGSVFRLGPPAPGERAWTLTTLHDFTAARPDGEMPLTGLAQDGQGALYGTTESTAGAPGRGTL